MADLIDREKLIEQLRDKLQDNPISNIWNSALNCVFKLIKAQPLADTERHAHWVVYDIIDIDEDYGGVEHHCSNCGFIEFYHSTTDFDDVYKYCRHCGCRMNEVNE